MPENQITPIVSTPQDTRCGQVGSNKINLLHKNQQKPL